MNRQNVISRLRRLLSANSLPQDDEETTMVPAASPMHPKLVENMQILAQGYGQLQTFASHRPVDRDGHATPWFTYPALEYLKRFDCNGWRVFEYGAGQSTIYWSKRGASVTSVEHNEQWFSEMRDRKLRNSQLLHRTDIISYSNAIREIDGPYDVIVVDGVWRDACAETCIGSLASDGFVILDNSDWYHETAQRLREQQFFEVSFSGFGPVNDYTWTTSFFFRISRSTQRNFTPPNPIGGIKLSPNDRNNFW